MELKYTFRAAEQAAAPPGRDFDRDADIPPQGRAQKVLVAVQDRPDRFRVACASAARCLLRSSGVDLPVQCRSRRRFRGGLHAHPLDPYASETVRFCFSNDND